MRLAFILFFISFLCFSQQSKKYECQLKTGKKSFLVTETLELMPNGTYSWWSTYDLAFEIKGTYTIKDNILKLKEKNAEKKFLISGCSIYMLNEKNRKVNYIKDKSIGGFKSWLKGYKFKYSYKEVNEFTFDNN